MHDSNRLRTPLQRRSALGALTSLTALGVLGCGGSGTGASSSTSTDATLSSLVVSSGSLSPTFSASTTTYTVSVANSVSTLTITPVSTSSSATITVNGTTVTSGSASAAVSLAVGTTTIAVSVTAADGSTTIAYSISAVRASSSSGDNCAIIPTETEGPYPLLAILSNTAIVRSDITEGTQTGVPLTLALTLENVNDSCAGISGAAIYVWHCNKDGEYSGYSSTANGDHSGETWLRGIQVTDANGQVTFTTIYPGWYSGRITHIHVQAYLNDNLTVTATLTTQLAFPQAITEAVYDSTLYTAHGQNTSVTSFSQDNVFSDGTSLQMMTITGDVDSGYAASIVLGIAA